jgi:hypothetical protein
LYCFPHAPFHDSDSSHVSECEQATDRSIKLANSNNTNNWTIVLQVKCFNCGLPGGALI